MKHDPPKSQKIGGPTLLGEQNASDQANFLLKTICDAAAPRAGVAISACDYWIIRFRG